MVAVQFSPDALDQGKRQIQNGTIIENITLEHMKLLATMCRILLKKCRHPQKFHEYH